MTKLQNFLQKIHFDKQTLLLLVIFILLVASFGISEEKFLAPRSISSMAFQLPEIGILSLAMMITVIINGINLSVNSIANLAAVVSGLFLLRVLPIIAPNASPFLTIVSFIVVALITGFLAGAMNGILIGYFGAPPILVTLASQAFFTGLAVGLTKGSSLTGFSDPIGYIGSKYFLGIPIPFIIFVGVTIVSYILLNHTTFGFKTRMLGTNPLASNFSGINNKSMTMKVHIYSGMLAAIAGILVMSRTMSASYQYGASTYVTLTLLVFVLAGVIAGSGNVINIFITVLILQVISTGFHMLLVGMSGSSFFKDFVWGLLLIFILIMNTYSNRSKSKE